MQRLEDNWRSTKTIIKINTRKGKETENACLSIAFTTGEWVTTSSLFLFSLHFNNATSKITLPKTKDPKCKLVSTWVFSLCNWQNYKYQRHADLPRIDWLILTACQPAWIYFMPRGQGIAFIIYLYLYFCVV